MCRRRRAAAVAFILAALSTPAPGMAIDVAAQPPAAAGTADVSRATAMEPVAGPGNGPEPRPEGARRHLPSASPPFMRVEVKLLIGALALAGLLWGAARLLRRLPLTGLFASAHGPIRVVARTHLGAKESLCLVNIGATSILLAITTHTIRTLHVWPDGVGATGQEPLRPGLQTSTDGPAVPGQLRNLRSWLPGAQR
jgi:flagellar biogenesis protein FliO